MQFTDAKTVANNDEGMSTGKLKLAAGELVISDLELVLNTLSAVKNFT